MVKVGGIYRDHVMNAQIKHELSVIFANPSLCKNAVTLSGTSFKVSGGFQSTTNAGVAVLSADKGFAINQMSLENRIDLGGGLKQAEFAIYTKNIKDAVGATAQRASFSAIYAEDGSGNLTDCRIVVSAQKACEDLGLTYSGGRCLICEKLGGTWDGAICKLSL
ncbi:hypothetical protein [Bdellovibrio svalbardensis]|uniref:Uncharacterized protein n=1 Tax=Bdellovibrio svalbardensis TaxID=2972972 RepID=A0ABT6DGX4_9BACT|nr:hypothetical protein [Bdellovibrio svalbardensis]MDG0816100.1 hypothetical protein [Bdellovibrio svalbardensis]